MIVKAACLLIVAVIGRGALRIQPAKGKKRNGNNYFE